MIKHSLSCQTYMCMLNNKENSGHIAPIALIHHKSSGRATPSRDPATASFRNDQTLKRNSTTSPSSMT